MTNILDILKKRILVLDGATGTQLQSFNLTADDFGGEEYDGCNENLNITRPDVVREVHRRYLEAGADIVETNSFGGTPIVLAEYDLGDKAYELSKLSAELAKEMADKYSTDDKPRFVAGSVGPTTKLLNISKDITFDEMYESYKVNINGLIDGGADIILLETSADTSNLKAAMAAFYDIKNEKNIDIPLMISVTIERNGTMLAGQSIEALYASIMHLNPISVGINCGLGPEQMESHIRTLSGICTSYTSVHPNAGLPDENGEYTQTPEIFSNVVGKLAREGYINIAGGCCGTTPEHIKALSATLEGITPRTPQTEYYDAVSGTEVFEFSDDKRPVFVGERTNMSGSKKFRKLIREEKFDEAAEIAKRQVTKGAAIIDINLADTETDEFDNFNNFMPIVLKKTKAPIMIDSSGPAEIFETGMKYLQGKCVINSINFENPERTDKIVEYIKKYGASVLIVLIDEVGMAISKERKLEVADRTYKYLKSHGIADEDMIFDPLVFPLGTGDKNYYLCAKYTIETVTELKKRYPKTKCSLGLSNCSFGLPPAGREVLNSVYLYHAVKAGADMSIINAEKMIRFASIPAEERKLCEDLLWDNSDENVQKFIGFYSKRKVKAKTEADTSNMSVGERLQYHIIEGIKTGLEKDLEEARKTQTPMEIINTHLMEGMGVVGKKFNANELTVIEVLQSAEVMKASVDYLKQFMEKSDTTTKGKFLIATVKGDVHDIGKNLVEIVLSNNGYEVIDLGIKVDSSTLIEAVKKHKPDYVGLSGLLVRSAIEMTVVAKDFKEAGIDVPLFIGGAALSDKFSLTKIKPNYDGSVVYSRDAISALTLLDHFNDPDKATIFEAELEERRMSYIEGKPLISSKSFERTEVKVLDFLPFVESYDEVLIDDIEFDTVYKYINKQMLFGKHFGFKGNFEKALADGDEKALKLQKSVDEIIEEIKRDNLIKPRALYSFFKVKKNGEELQILDKDEKVIETFRFPRQSKGEMLSISDYVHPELTDSIAIFSSTAGEGVANLAKKYKDSGEYTKSHILFSLAIESAEAMAEITHEIIRAKWGMKEELEIKDMLSAKYKGCRYSPGYPACPDLSDQDKIFRLLSIKNKLGVSLTDGYMMEPEASVTAMVFHHKDAKYFMV